MILTDQDILTLMVKPRNGDAVSAGVKLQSEHKVHITGEGYEGEIWQVSGFESTADFNVKQQVSKPATIQITAICLDNLNRWVSSQGTVKRIYFENADKTKQFETILSKCWHDQSFEEFIKTFYKEAIYTEFNGFALVTKPKLLEGGLIEKEGVTSKHVEGKSLDPYIIFISASDVYDFHLTGNKTEYLIIKLGDDKFRLIDDVKDTIYKYNTEKKTVTNEGEIFHNLGYVPAKKVSSINKFLLNDQIKTSPIDHVIPALDRYFSSDSDLRMQFIRHNYPKLMAVTRECHKCGGVGHYFEEGDNETKLNCRTCDGTGREIPISRDGVLGLPQYLEQGHTAYPGSPASYVTPDNESLRLALEDLKQQREDIIYSATGDKNLIAESLNAATENSINNRSLEDRISEITSMVEQFEVFLKKCIKDLHNEFKGIAEYSITVKYGRRITTKGESDLLKEIKDAKESGMPFSYIKGLHKDLIYTKYKNNEDEYNRYLILSDVEPLCGYSLEEVVKMSSYLDNRDIEVKANFDSLIDEFETDNVNVQYYEIKQPYEVRVSLIKTKLYEILSEQTGRSDWNRRPTMAVADSKRAEDGGDIPGSEFGDGSEPDPTTGIKPKGPRGKT